MITLHPCQQCINDFGPPSFPILFYFVYTIFPFGHSDGYVGVLHYGLFVLPWWHTMVSIISLSWKYTAVTTNLWRSCHSWLFVITERVHRHSWKCILCHLFRFLLPILIIWLAIFKLGSWNFCIQTLVFCWIVSLTIFFSKLGVLISIFYFL